METQQLMIKASRSAWTPLGWALALGVSLAMAGCGGQTTPPKSEAESKVAANPAPPPAKAKVSPRGRRGAMLAEGGEMTAQERRAARLKAKKAESEQSQ
jgi:hypothetical protein